MRSFRAFLFTIVTVIGFSFAISAQSFTPSTAVSRSVDEQVYRKLKYLPNTNVFDHIEWQVNGSTVTLTGKVYTLGTKKDAVNAVRSIPGVTEVVSSIETLPGSPYDDRIRREALREFTSRGPSQYFSETAPDVKIIVEGGRLTLEGNVARKSDSDLLNVLANGISGVFQVTNNLVVGQRKF